MLASITAHDVLIGLAIVALVIGIGWLLRHF